MGFSDKQSRRVGLLVYNTVADDPRVRRQGDAFHQAGWQVVASGLPGGRADPPVWMKKPVVRTAERSTFQSNVLKVETAVRNFRPAKIAFSLLRLLTRTMPHRVLQLSYHALVAFRPAAAFDFFWKIMPEAQLIYEKAAISGADVWIANDWNTLPVAMRLQDKLGGEIVYDTHEFAIDEYNQRLLWRVLRKPLVREIEARGISNAAAVMTVSKGIAVGLQAAYGLEREPDVVRNTPSYEQAFDHEITENFKILYHGVVAPGRGLELCIEAASLWREGITFSIRGPVASGYKSQLLSLIKKWGVEDKVGLLEPVPMPDLVSEAAPFDIGLFALPGHSKHNQYALPNKLFEYIMAGLCVCISDLPEMKRIVEETGAGLIIADETPEAIAQAIDGLDVETVIRHRAGARMAAEQLCWENESKKLLEIAERAIWE